MDEQEQKICPNCKREIPAVNFTIHSVHCARNIRMCPVCKEPVPQAELEDHHDKMHKLMPCKQCGEKVCGTDLEDHVRDSCGHTIKSCRYCELELPRRDLPAHESYCGVRTEQCGDCHEWVMIKYRQLHLDSNHGFLRLDDDPDPQPKKDTPKPAYVPKPAAPKVMNLPQPSTSDGAVKIPFVKDTNLTQNRPQTIIRYLGSSSNGPSTSNSTPNINRPQTNVTTNVRPIDNLIGNGSRASGSDRSEGQLYNGLGGKVLKKRTNEQPQINTAVTAANKVDTQPISRAAGAVKKRPAPPPPQQPRRPPTNEPKREMAYYSALRRSQEEERARQEQNAYNLAHGLPPVLTAAEKVERLRKMDALHNRETQNDDYKNRLQGRVWMDRTFVATGNVLGSDERVNTDLETDRRRRSNNHREDFNDLQPMSTEEFMEKFKELQIRKDKDDRSERKADRFSEIKSSLRELRRGLNEVTAPYNTNNFSSANSERERVTRSPEPDQGSQVFLPCEFCGAPVLADCLVQHQTGCRPDLAQYRPGSASPRTPRSVSPLAPGPTRGASSGPTPASAYFDTYDAPVIPCEFCSMSLPVYMITEHQESCGR